jgi:peptidoglycan/LPS O-acetylase OafA/YrhL
MWRGSFALIVLGLSWSREPLTRALSSSGAVLLGKISYSIYLMHALVIAVLRGLAPAYRAVEAAYPLAIAVAYLCVAIAAGYALYSTVEEPGRDFIRRRWVAPAARLQP